MTTFHDRRAYKPNDASHPYFSADNMVTVIRQIERAVKTATGTPVYTFTPDAEFGRQVMRVANEYLELFIHPDSKVAAQKLNDILVARTVKAATESDTAGQHWESNYFHRLSRQGNMAERDGANPKQSTARVTLASDTRSRYHSEFLAQDRALQEKYLKTEDRFTKVFPDTVYWNHDTDPLKSEPARKPRTR